MARINIRTGTRYLHAKEAHIVRDVLGEDHYHVENLNSGENIVVSYKELLHAWASGELRFEVEGGNAQAIPDTFLKVRYRDDDIADLPSHIQDETWRRYELVLSLYRHHDITTVQMLSRDQIERFIQHQGWVSSADIASGTRMGDAISVGSIERYLQAYVHSGGDIRSLVPQTRQRGGKGRSRLDEAVERIITQVLEKYVGITERESTVDQIVTDIVNQIADENRFRDTHSQLSLPHERTIRRRIKTAGEKRILGRRLSRREQKAQSEILPSDQPTRILERVEIDHTKLDLFVVDERDGLPIGRPNITACIDKYSALVLGWHIDFQPSSYKSIMLCLRHALLPKPDYRDLYGTEHDYPVFGLFEKLCIDNGRDFKSAALKAALAELGIIREQMPKETPWFKGSIERYFRSVNQQLLKGTPGYSFGNVLQLGDYNAQKDAVISLSAFLEIFHIFMVDIYPYSWHEGLEAIPMHRWQTSWALFKPALFEDATTLRIILLPSAERVLRGRGIEWQNNFYSGPDLPRLRELYGLNKVRFKYDPDNMDMIYVRDASDPDGWVPFHSTHPEYTRGLSLAKHRMIRQAVHEKQQQVDRYSLARAKAHIQQVIEREFYTTKKLRKRSRLKPMLNQMDAPPSIAPQTEPQNPISDTDEPYTPNLDGWSSDYDLPLSGGRQK